VEDTYGALHASGVAYGNPNCYCRPGSLDQVKLDLVQGFVETSFHVDPADCRIVRGPGRLEDLAADPLAVSSPRLVDPLGAYFVGVVL
jgi:hypothetical protein